MDALTCLYCMRQFRYRDLFLQHQLSCDYFLRQKRARETDALEDLPSGQDQFKWIQALALRVGKLERDVARLWVSDGTRRRSGIQAWLRNPLCPRPSRTLTFWLSEVWIDMAQLDSDKNLVEIMQIMFSEALGLPMCAFAGCKTVYAWDNAADGEPTWIVVTVDRWNGYFARLQHRFRKALSWNDCNEACDEVVHREGVLQRMRKVNEGGRGKRDLLLWLRKQLETKSPVVS